MRGGWWSCWLIGMMDDGNEDDDEGSDEGGDKVRCKDVISYSYELVI